jgi:site-specific DNA-methyltransferase (adenine-specific)
MKARPTRRRRRRRRRFNPAALVGDDGYCVIGDNALAVLDRLPPNSIDGLVTDPPYGSGALWTSGRKAPPETKYQSYGSRDAYGTFLGEARDQRSWCRWMTWCLENALRVCKPGAPACVFIDWRQLPAMTDAFQMAGWVWRGVAVWDKTKRCRPQKGRFKAQAEFVVWGSKGKMPRERGVPALPGVFRVPVDPRDKYHMAGKPVALMQELVEIVAPGGTVLDPFAGSGSTGVAAMRSGRSFIGIEMHEPALDVCRERLAAAAQGLTLREARELAARNGESGICS